MTDVQSAFSRTGGIEPEGSGEAPPEDADAGPCGSKRRISPKTGRRSSRPGLLGDGSVAARLLALAIAPVIVLALTLAGCSSGHNTGQPTPSTSTSKATHKTRPKTHCSASGCAVVRTSRSFPPLTIFYGASCSGVHGDWFFNAVEGGGSDTVRPSYALQWSFAGGATSARPNARTVTVPRTKTTTVRITLSNGTMKLSGTRKPNTKVTATGSLLVKLTGSASAPSLTFMERGLHGAEHRLGLTSPFDVGGRPLVVSIKHVTTLRGC